MAVTDQVKILNRKIEQNESSMIETEKQLKHLYCLLII